MPSSKSIAGLIIACLVLTFIVVGIPIIVYEAVVKPRNPTFTLDQASVTGFNLTSNGRLTAFFEVTIRANNPNHKLKLKYEHVRVSIYKDKQKLAEDALPGFTQHKRNVTFLRAEPVALDVGLKKGPAFDFGLESGMGYLDFDVFMMATLNGDNDLQVNCPDAVVNINFSSSPMGFVAGAPSSANAEKKFRRIDCSVYIYSDYDYY